VFAVGYNYNYQFGVDHNNENHPTEIELEWSDGLSISYVCSGLTHMCYLSFSGNYYFCGQIDTEKLGIPATATATVSVTANRDNKDNSNHNHNHNNKVITHCRSPLNLGDIRVSRVADGISSRHMIVMTRDYRALAMGCNQKGQLGLGHYKSTVAFETIALHKTKSDLENYVALDVIDASCGDSHSALVVMPRCTLPVPTILRYYCLRYALPRTFLCSAQFSRLILQYVIKSQSLISGEPRGRLYVCGCNNFGQLGLGHEVKQCVNVPVQVTESGLAAVSIAQVSCGENHTVCLDNRGRVYAFGDNYYGQSGSHVNHYENVYYPLKIEHLKQEYSARIVKVSSGKYHCVALDKLGRVFCWGLGAYGQLGCNKLNKRMVLPILVDTLADEKIIDVRCGTYHTIALSNRSKLFCWGSNNYGQCFQSASHENVITPQLAKIGSIQQQNLSIYKVFCGYYSTIVLALPDSDYAVMN